jgi:hypothetical protein
MLWCFLGFGGIFRMRGEAGLGSQHHNKNSGTKTHPGTNQQGVGDSKRWIGKSIFNGSGK